MSKELFSLSEKIKHLRECAGMTQADLARVLGLSRSGVNAWEMGLSIPSTQYVVELAKTFNVSSDYLLGIQSTSTISVKDLTDEQINVLVSIINCFRNSNVK